MRAVIDRFEEDEAVCETVETKQVLCLPVDKLPEGARVGSVLVITEDTVSVDAEETELRTVRANMRLKSLWKE